MRRNAGFLFIFGAAAPLVILVSSAWACGTLATLKAAPSTATAGQTVQATGAQYTQDPTFTPVQIRLDSRTGPVLKEVTPVGSKFSTTFQLPATVAAGDHLLIATQNRIADGVPKSGTPGRTVMRVQGAGKAAAAGSSASAGSPWSNSKPGAPGGSAASIGSGDQAPLGIGVSLALLSIGVTLVARDRATRRARRLSLGA